MYYHILIAEHAGRQIVMWSNTNHCDLYWTCI